MRVLIVGRIAQPHRLCQRNGLLKREAEAVARHCVHRSRCISDQRHPPPRDGWQDIQACGVTQLPGCLRCSPQFFRKNRESRQRFLEPQRGIGREHGNANLLRWHWRDKYLAARRPVNFNCVRPRPYFKVTAKTESLSSGYARIESCPFADQRILAIRADEPAVGNSFFCRRHSLRIELPCLRPPAEFHSRFGCMVEEQLMQFYAAYGKARRARKIRAYGMFPIHKPDSAERKGAFRRKGYAEPAQSGNPLRQDALSAGLVYWGYACIQNRYLQIKPARGNRRNDARRSRSDNDDLTLSRHN